MNKCCGVTCKTPYCPICGKFVNPMPLVALLYHCRAVAQNKRKCADTALSRLHKRAANNGPSEYQNGQKRYVEKLLAAAEKWESWAMALADVVEEDVSDD